MADHEAILPPCFEHRSIDWATTKRRPAAGLRACCEPAPRILTEPRRHEAAGTEAAAGRGACGGRRAARHAQPRGGAADAATEATAAAAARECWQAATARTAAAAGWECWQTAAARTAAAATGECW